ncbi:MAG: glycine cleavage system aminomethyltransferase GcvT [Anaerolineae bacterium]|nr:glycine cleavage system aminomethyltransferase GcvT [Anaerolineae bacterium]
MPHHRDYLFRGDLEELDPDVAELIRHETARQQSYLILIPSESTVPAAVREALASSFHNLYAEGYPLDETRTMTQQEILDYGMRLPEYRRIADKRYYKGTEYSDIVEALARRRCAEVMATDEYPAEKLFVNVQALSGAPANNAIFGALLNLGDTIMGMDLLQGGHLTHGSPVNRSGKQYKAVGYGVDPVTEKLDYDAIMALALEHKPRLIVAGYTSYPYAPDWAKFREIADACGAYLMADISHVSGLVVAGAFPNPVGYADVISFTTHKTLHGPRGAAIVTHRADIAIKVDRSVFPGEQGGPHVNTMAAMAVSFRLATTEQFRELQRQTVANATRLAQKLSEHGLRISYGGTNTHMVLFDCKTVVGEDGTPLSGDMAARILDLCGIVANRNTIPGDVAALRASGVRLGTPWITQRGFGEAEIDQLAEIIARVIKACVPFSYTGKRREEPRAKIDFDVLQQAKLDVEALAKSVGIDTDVKADGYPHLYYMFADTVYGWQTLFIRGAQAAKFLDAALTCDVHGLAEGQQQPTWILSPDGKPMSRAFLEKGPAGYYLYVAEKSNRVAAWLRSLSDGFVVFDPTDPYAKLPGPVDVQHQGPTAPGRLGLNAKAAWDDDTGYAAHKAYFIGMNGVAYAGPTGNTLPAFTAPEETSETLLTTPLHGLHVEMGARMTAFAGYDMPVWYTSVAEEHMAVRTGAGVFDVTHMGVFEAKGAGAEAFLDAVTTNDVYSLATGESQYTYLLDTSGVPLDDLMIYKLGDGHYLIVVNASNNDKNWAWLNAVKDGRVMIDAAQPWRKLGGRDRFTLRDLRAESSGADRRVDIALQGPQSKAILQGLGGSEADLKRVSGLAWAGVTQARLGEFDLIISRTGYTGERTAYELFVHPDQAAAFFRKLIAGGATACGLAARDSLRTEAGLPLYGHELGGDLKLNPADAGFGSYVKLWKTFFVGKQAFIRHEGERDSEIVRFRLERKGARPPHSGDRVLNEAGETIGVVTSCSIDSERYQLGQAYVKEAYGNEGVRVIVQRHDGSGTPEPAAVLSRFPKAKKKS